MIERIQVGVYGILPENLQKEGIKAIAKAITINYPRTTFTDLEEAYSREIDRKPFQNLTRDEFLAPLKAYLKSKQVVLSKREEMTREARENERKEQDRQLFISESLQIFEESKQKGEWLGTPAQASAVLTLHKQQGDTSVTGILRIEQKEEIYAHYKSKRDAARLMDEKQMKENVHDTLFVMMDVYPKFMLANDLMKKYFEVNKLF
jgi:hypothetical protein